MDKEHDNKLMLQNQMEIGADARRATHGYWPVYVRFVDCFYVYFVYEVYRRQHLCILRRRILAWCSIQSIRSIQYNGPCLGYHTVHARCCACSWCCACSVCSRSKLSICQYIGSICHRMCQYFNFYICSKPLQYVSGALAGVGGSLLKQ